MSANRTKRTTPASDAKFFRSVSGVRQSSLFRSNEHRRRFRTIAITVLIGMTLAFSSVPFRSQEKIKGKIDIFRGTLVAAGPKAITVKSLENIYHLRTFNYSLELEKKMPKKKLVPGQKITVHYVRGTSWAVKVD